MPLRTVRMPSPTIVSAWATHLVIFWNKSYHSLLWFLRSKGRNWPMFVYHLSCCWQNPFSFPCPFAPPPPSMYCVPICLSSHLPTYLPASLSIHLFNSVLPVLGMYTPSTSVLSTWTPPNCCILASCRYSAFRDLKTDTSFTPLPLFLSPALLPSILIPSIAFVVVVSSVNRCCCYQKCLRSYTEHLHDWYDCHLVPGGEVTT